MKNKIQSFQKTLTSVAFLFGHVWQSSKIYVILKALGAILTAVMSLPTIILPGLIINELANGFQNGIMRIILLTCLLILIPFCGNLMRGVLDKAIVSHARDVSMKLKVQFFNKVNDLPVELYDDPDFIDKMYLNYDLVYDIQGIVDQIGALITDTISIIAISSIIMTLSPVTILVVIVCIFLTSILTKRINKKQYDCEKEMSRFERITQGAIEEFGFITEIRMFHLKDFLLKKYKDAKRGENDVLNRFDKQMGSSNILITLIGAAQQLYLYVYLIYLVLAGEIAVGSMTIYMNAVGQFSSSLNAVVNSYLRLANNNYMAEDIKSFQSIPTAVEESGKNIPVIGKDSVIEFRNVSFKYPGSDNYALKNLSLKLRGNERLCIVGENGSGKTTFIKLLTRLYKPTEGEILLDGVNIREYDYEAYQHIFSPVLQDFWLFNLTIKENIVLEKPYDEKKLYKICSDSDLDSFIEKLPKHYDTPVYKTISHDGFNPSGGEEQKIAIARACYQGGAIHALDEPTSALDPLAEQRMFGQIENMTKDKPALLITHRLSAAKLAEHIAVFDKGQLVEYGSHDKVYALHGIYTEMYDKQAEFYQ